MKSITNQLLNPMQLHTPLIEPQSMLQIEFVALTGRTHLAPQLTTWRVSLYRESLTVRDRPLCSFRISGFEVHSYRA